MLSVNSQVTLIPLVSSNCFSERFPISSNPSGILMVYLSPAATDASFGIANSKSRLIFWFRSNEPSPILVPSSLVIDTLVIKGKSPLSVQVISSSASNNTEFVFTCSFWVVFFCFSFWVTASVFSSFGVTASVFSSSGVTASVFSSSGVTASVFSSCGVTASVFSSCGVTASVFSSCGATASVFSSSGVTASVFSSSGVTVSVFSSSGATVSVFSSSGATDSVFSSSGVTVFVFSWVTVSVTVLSCIPPTAATGCTNDTSITRVKITLKNFIFVFRFFMVLSPFWYLWFHNY